MRRKDALHRGGIVKVSVLDIDNRAALTEQAG
jgi:hypothetical protein